MPADGAADATPTEPTPTEAPANATPADPVSTDATSDEPDGKKKKKKKHGDGEGDLVSSDDLGGVSSHSVNFRFLIQSRYTQTFVREPLDQTVVLDPRLHDGYSINRAFMRATMDPKPWLSSKVLIDFAEFAHRSPKRALKLAYAELTPDKHFSVTVGLFKRPFSLLELLPIAEYELADVGPTDTLIKDAELGGRDTGAMVRWSPLHKSKRLSIQLAVFDGNLHGTDAHWYGLMSGRIASEPVKHLQLGIDGAWRPRGEGNGGGLLASPGKGRALSADATWHTKRYEVRAEWLWGDRSDETYAVLAKTWMAAWAIAAVRIPVSSVVLMPAARFEWLDADREHGIGMRWLASGALNVMDVTDAVRVLLDVSRSHVQAGSFPLSVAPVLLDRSSTTVVVQVQVKI